MFLKEKSRSEFLVKRMMLAKIKNPERTWADQRVGKSVVRMVEEHAGK